MPTGCEKIPEMNIRAVEAQDSSEILRWRNDDVTRAMSLDSELVDVDQHKKWFARLLDDQRRIAFVGTVGRKAIGWVRFDPLEDRNEFLVSISVAPESRLKGMGSQLLGQALQQLRLSCDEPVVYAKVKDSNLASLKLFEKHGFKKSEQAGALHTLILSTRTVGRGSRV